MRTSEIDVSALPEKDLRRFWSKVMKTDYCWSWCGSTFWDGYGMFNVRCAGHKFQMRAHRVAYTIFHGPIPDGLFVLHSCDNRKCVNPSHLRVGSRADNVQDAIDRRRYKAGAEHYGTKLSTEDVAFIRAYCTPKKYGRQREMARKYGISEVAVSNIVNRKRRKVVEGERE